MRRSALRLSIATLLLAASPLAQAQTPPPHAWLFGAWTGGLFPAPSQETAAQCLAQPTVIFTRDVVLTASLLETIYGEHPVQTVRVTGNGAEIRFASPPALPSNAGSQMLGLEPPAPTQVGIGCDTPGALTIVRRNENEIVFENCPQYPNPLVRCPSK